MSEKKSFLSEEYTQLITEIRNHLWVACTKYNNEMPRELKDLLGNYKLAGPVAQCDIHSNMVHALDHMDKLLTKIGIDPHVIDTADIDLGIEKESGKENKLWRLTFALDNGVTWHEYNAVIKGPDADFVTRRLLEINRCFGGDVYIPHDAIKVECIDKNDYICFTTIPPHEFKNKDGGKK